MITATDVALLRGMGIQIEEGVLADVPVDPEDTGRIKFEDGPRGKVKTIPAKAPTILKAIRNAPRSVPVSSLVLTFGEGVLSMLNDMVHVGLLNRWENEAVPGQLLVYVNPDKKDHVDKLLRKVEKWEKNGESED